MERRTKRLMGALLATAGLLGALETVPRFVSAYATYHEQERRFESTYSRVLELKYLLRRESDWFCGAKVDGRDLFNDFENVTRPYVEARTQRGAHNGRATLRERDRVRDRRPCSP